MKKFISRSDTGEKWRPYIVGIFYMFLFSALFLGIGITWNSPNGHTETTSSIQFTESPDLADAANVTPKPDRSSYSFNGTGRTSTDDFTISGGLTTFKLSHNGDSNFFVWVIQDEEPVKQLVNAIGAWDGEYAIKLPKGNYHLLIQADENWMAKIRQHRYSSVEIRQLPLSVSEEDSEFIGPVNFKGRTQITLEANESEHYRVSLLTDKGEKVSSLFSKIGPFENTVTFNKSMTGIIFIDTNGEYEIEIKSIDDR